MRQFRTACVCAMIAAGACPAAFAADTNINGVVGAIYGTAGAPELNAGWVGGWNNGAGFISVGVHNLGGLTVANVPQAILRIPEQDSGGGGDVNAYNANRLTICHIDAGNDTQPSTGDDTATNLGQVGVYRNPGPTNTDVNRYVEFDVTDLVHADIMAGRGSFAWRITHDAAAAYHGYRRYSTTGGNIPVLIVKMVGSVEGPCNDSIDNDGDSLIDCADPDCADRAACPEDCDNLIDDDANGLVDCLDPDCAGDPACPETICDDGQDNDGDSLVDCADPDCTDALNCPEICNDSIDNDADGDVDCDDSECAGFPAEPCTESICNDSLDGDMDGLTDCADPDCATSFVCGGGELCIKPTGAQDAHVYNSIALVENTAQGFWGKYNGQGLNFVSIHTLPPGVTAGDVAVATLRLARTDNAWTADASALNLRMLLNHIDAANDSMVTAADGSSVALDGIGLYRDPGPYVLNNSRSITYNVTAQVKADLLAGRATFAHRIEAETISDGAVSARYIPTIENTDAAFPADIRGATLCLLPSGFSELEGCSDGIDNDNDGLTDCADPECSNEPACPEVCNDSVDNDADGLIDCADSECLGNSACPEGLCGDGLDNDMDGKIDCLDPDCFGGLECQTETACGDGEDNDNDCFIDASDPDCTDILIVYPTNLQDGEVFSNGGPSNAASAFGIWGSFDTANQIQVMQAGIHNLPAAAPGNVVSAELRIPEPSLIWTAGGFAVLNIDVDVLHIDAADDTKITDGDGNSAPLTNLGAYRGAGDPPRGNGGFASLDVTNAVKADLTAGRTTFAWRLNSPDTLPLGTGGENNPQVYFPTVDNSDGAFPPANRGARLVLRIAGLYENDCGNSIDDDADGAVDCADSDCYSELSCGEICGDGLDNDGDTFTDCADSDCLFNPCCEGPLEICTNGVDDDGDEAVDCDDSDCACAPNCGVPPAEVCDNAEDDDCDGDVDCDDSDCANLPVCQNCNDPFADEDGDGDVDGDDFAALQRCVTGGGGGVPAGCACFNADGDDDIDVNDYGFWLNCASGADVPAETSCDGGP